MVSCILTPFSLITLSHLFYIINNYKLSSEKTYLLLIKKYVNLDFMEFP